ncbi:MAG: hypothetical protein AB7E96_00830 [Deferribacterales bacterium]
MDNELLPSTSVSITLADVKDLLTQSFPLWVVTTNAGHGNVNIQLTLTADNDTLLHKPPLEFYSISSAPSKEGVRLVVSSPTPQGITYGLYALLSEKLGFRFYHPKNTYVPIYENWFLEKNFTFTGEPVFNARGFHLHTMHPIELTEPLFNPHVPFGMQEVKEYIDWLVRNGQNRFQFWVLRTADRETWTQYASEYVNYARQRGIQAGAVVSLSTLQQKAFQMINLLNIRSYKDQIDDNCAWLMRVPFDYVCIDFTMGEYLPDLARILPESKNYLMSVLHDKYHTQVFENTHVIKRKPSGIPDYTGILIHSVMFYSLDEEQAPVYGNSNIKFMLEKLREEKRKRETWYWPESSYWVTFDTSVPLFLLPYLTSRYDDIRLLKPERIDGHVTFTSGWEWGYWITDYSIAKWSWKYSDNGKEIENGEDFVLTELFGKESKALWHKAFLIQQKYMKDMNLIPLLAARTPFEELPWPFNRSFQPDDGFSVTKAAIPFLGNAHRQRMKEKAGELMEFYTRLDAVTDEIERLTPPDKIFLKDTLRYEIINAMRVTALRAKHRHYTLLAGAYRNIHLKDSSEYYFKCQLALAKETRQEAEKIVRKQEMNYRYPISLIARNTDTHTSYSFGYLYPVSDLYFWQREEKQAEWSRFDAFFMNLWNFTRTLGLDGLF